MSESAIRFCDQEADPRAMGLLSLITPFDLMKFMLTYSGKLPSSGNSRKLSDVWVIRNALHPQLAELWQTHPVLLGLGFHAEATATPPRDRSYLSAGRRPSWASSERPEAPTVDVTLRSTPRSRQTIRLLSSQIERNGNSFLPIVRQSLSLMCDLDILFMRKEEPGGLVLQGGDTDGRLKTLFDALRVPSDGEIKNHKPIAQPLYCVMEQDTLIANHSLKTDRLLTAPQADVHQVHLVIGVTIRVMRISWENIGFIGE